MTMEDLRLAMPDKKAISQIVKKIQLLQKVFSDKLVILTFGDLYKFLEKEEREIIGKFLQINPGDFGFLGPKFGISRVNSNFQAISNQKINFQGKSFKIQTQYLPKNVLR